MLFDLDRKTVALSVGEFADFSFGPRESAETGAAGLWRAQLGTHWHNELRARAASEHATAAVFEIPITGQIAHRGWVFTLTGRIDQILRPPGQTVLREIKTVTRSLPADETELRADYPGYFIQLASYAALARLGMLQPAADADLSLPSPTRALRAELVFVETASGLVQTIPLTPADDRLFQAQLERCTEFLQQRWRARERLRGLRFRPAFAVPRPGQETTQSELNALFQRHPLVLFEAPTGFGKTGVLLEFALTQLRSGHFDRALYLTSKSTGQLQVVRTLSSMTAVPGVVDGPAPQVERPVTPSHQSPESPSTSRLQLSTATGSPVAVWHVRNKAEHCVNTVFHCVRDQCLYLADAAERWPQSGLARFYLDEHHARDLDTLRHAGRDARICPYEITRTALAFNDVWIGDYNYVFAPRNRGLFYDQPGFNPARTLLLVDEAHNLPARVADAYSHVFSSAEAYAVLEELHRVRPLAALVNAWDHWCHFLHHLRACDALSPEAEDDARHLLEEFTRHLRGTLLDYGALGPQVTEALWSAASLLDEISDSALPRLWWAPRDGELTLTCLDAAPAIGAALREFGGAVLASATLTPVDGFAAACGLAEADVAREASAVSLSTLASPTSDSPPAPDRLGELSKRDTRKLYRQLARGSDLLKRDAAREAAQPAVLRAHTPWRDGAYDIAFDARVDTTFQHRSRHFATTAATIAALHESAGRPGPLATAARSVAVFFPSYAYAESILHQLSHAAPGLRAALQPKLRDLAAQSAWVEESLLLADALFLVLGSSFAESIDSLGGRVSHAMVVGPALPEVNAVQRARLEEATRSGLGREAAFRRVYQIPGMNKVNQALGRLVRAPGQRARVLLQCRRFLEPSYASLLAPEYQLGRNLLEDSDLAAWLEQPATTPSAATGASR